MAAHERKGTQARFARQQPNPQHYTTLRRHVKQGYASEMARVSLNAPMPRARPPRLARAAAHAAVHRPEPVPYAVQYQTTGGQIIFVHSSTRAMRHTHVGSQREDGL